MYVWLEQETTETRTSLTGRVPPFYTLYDGLAPEYNEVKVPVH